jgi:hypothetical protein
LDDAYSKQLGEEFWSEQRIIWGPEFGGTRDEILVVDSQLLGDFWTGDTFLENTTLCLARGQRFKILFGLGRG